MNHKTLSASAYVLVQACLKEAIKVISAPRGLVDIAAWRSALRQTQIPHRRRATGPSTSVLLLQHVQLPASHAVESTATPATPAPLFTTRSMYCKAF